MEMVSYTSEEMTSVVGCRMRFSEKPSRLNS